jgi:hypothetical protein
MYILNMDAIIIKEDAMFPYAIKNILCILFLIIIVNPIQSYSEYIEGIDTTEENGYASDSTFWLNQNDSYICGHLIAGYSFLSVGARGYFNYSFDDITLAPLTQRPLENLIAFKIYYCFVTMNPKDSTYSKCQILNKISDHRYVFRYGRNTTPHDRILTHIPYNQAIMYKPNNLFVNPGAYPNPASACTTYWDPPLPNNNHLIGYVFYRSKNNITIDTSGLLKMEQWDSIAFYDTSSTSVFNPAILQPGYFNIAAVYAEGKSEFLIGWTKSQYALDKLNPTGNPCIKGLKIARITNVAFDYCISIEQPIKNITIYNLNGKIIWRYGSFVNSAPFLFKSHVFIKNGLYLLRAEFPDRSVITQPFTITR